MSMPVIANGGCGSIEHIKDIFKNTKVSAAAAGSFFVYQKKGMGVLINYLNNSELKEVLFL
jgi:cyclase